MAHRHEGRADRDQSEAETAREQQPRAGERAKRRDERPDTLGEAGRIGPDEAARGQQPEAQKNHAKQEVKGHAVT
jgi:hypothetical protein